MSIRPENYRFYLIMNFAAQLGFGLHLGFIFLFQWLGLTKISYFNLASCAVYALIYLLNRKGYHNLSAAIGLSDVVLFSFILVVTVGWGSGFQYYLLAVLPFIFLNELWREPIKFTVVGLLYVIFLGLLFSYRHALPLYTTPQGILDAMLGFNLAALFAIYGMLAYYYGRLTASTESRLRQVNERLENLAARDDLTSLLNRREMRRRLEYEINRNRLDGSDFVVVLGDIDHFKGINDSYGHHAGDHVLISLTRVMRNTLRKNDQLARWGGEEFLLLLPDTGLADGRLVAEKLREQIAGTTFRWEGSPIFVTMTFGVSVFDRDCGFDEVLRAADNALILGKIEGKNCVVTRPANSGAQV